MALFTAILEYKGGNYTRQIRAKSVSEAFLKWFKTVDQHGVPGIGPKIRERVLRELADAKESTYPFHSPCLLSGLRMWYCSLPKPFSAVTACLNIVQTEEEQQVPLTTRFSAR
jgi:hypothetical protein